MHGFFVISGYLITISFTRSASVGAFSMHRALRILPGLLVVLLMMRVAWYIFDRFQPILHNGPLWTLSWEAVCYACVALLGVLGILQKRNFPVFFVCAWTIYLTNVSGDSEAVQIVAPMLMLFMGGAFIAIMEDSINVPKMAAISLPVLFILFVPGMFTPTAEAIRSLGFAHGAPLSDWQVHEIPYLMTLPFAVIYVGKYIPSSIAIKHDLSYGIYIYGWPVATVIGYVFYNNVSPIRNPYLDFAIVLPVTLLFAIFSWFCVEKPALSFKRYLVGRAPAYQTTDQKAGGV